MISSATVRFLSVRSTRKVYITYTKWCVNRMMQGEETTTIYIDLLQVGLTSFLDSGASFWGCEVAERATKSGEVYKSAFLESLQFVVSKFNSPRQSTYLLVEYAFWNSCPRLKRKIRQKPSQGVLLKKLKYAFGSMSTQQKMLQKFYSGSCIEKIIRVTHRQTNAPAVFLLRETYHRHNRLPIDRKENFTKWSILVYKSKKIIRVKSQANECPSVSAAQSNFYPTTQKKMLQHWFILVCKRNKNY